MFSLFSAYPTFMIFLGVAIAMVITMAMATPRKIMNVG